MGILATMQTGLLWWLKKGARESADYIADAQVIVEPYNGPRPTPPYLSIQAIGPLRRTSLTGKRTVTVDGNGDATAAYSASRVSAFRIQGFGEGALDWLETARLVLDDPDVQVHVEGLGMAIYDDGDVLDLTYLLDSNYEHRYSLDVTVSCRIEVDGVVVTEATTTSTATTLEDDVGPDLVFTVIEP